MGPKLLLSDISTKEQPVLRWRLRVKGNTAVEFGVIPVEMSPSHTALHKCLAVPGAPHQRCVGFCSQITAGSLLPLKAPVMRGTIVDILARRGHIEVVLMYPEDAKEIHWQNGQPIQRPYRGPSQLRFEQDFSADYDVKIAVTSWAKACFDILHVAAENRADWTAPATTSASCDAVALPSTEAAAAALQAHFLQQAAAHLPALAMPGALALLEDKSEGQNEASISPMNSSDDASLLLQQPMAVTSRAISRSASGHFNQGNPASVLGGASPGSFQEQLNALNRSVSSGSDEQQADANMARAESRSTMYWDGHM